MADASAPRPSVSNYTPNSAKSKQPADTTPPEDAAKKVQRVTTSDVVRVKKPLGRKIMDTFKGDDVHSVGSYVLFEVVLPQVKTAISDAVSQGIERMLFGDSRPSRGPSARGGYTPYNRVAPSSTSGRREEPRSMSREGRARHDFGEVVLRDRAEAQQVFDILLAQIDQYDRATVADLYDAVGITPGFTDNKWGWLSLADAQIRRDRDGFLLDLPRPEQLD